MAKIEIIAEAGINHGGRLDCAAALVAMAKMAGSDVIKFQTFDVDHLLAPGHPDTNALRSVQLSRSDTLKLARVAEQEQIEFMSTPGDLDSLKFLVEEAGVKRIKIGSDDMTYRPLVDAAQSTGLPLIVSTGMANGAEISQLVEWFGSRAYSHLTLMHCVSLYPCPPESLNLSAITTLQDRFHYVLPVGYSDHTEGVAACWIAAAMGAVVIEKHIKPEEDWTCLDQDVSVGPDKFRRMVEQVRMIEKMAGHGQLERTPEELANIPKFRKGADGKRQIT